MVIIVQMTMGSESRQLGVESRDDKFSFGHVFEVLVDISNMWLERYSLERCSWNSEERLRLKTHFSHAPRQSD